MWVFLAFLAVPLIEIALFIQVGGLIGLWPTLLIVVLTAIVGTWLVQSQGRMALGNLRGSFERLQDPTEHLAHGAMILFAGALLLTPGFFTDALGLALLTPPVRLAVYKYLRARVRVQQFQMGGRGDPFVRPDHPQQRDHDVVDAEYTEVSPTKRPTHGGSGWTKH